MLGEALLRQGARDAMGSSYFWEKDPGVQLAMSMDKGRIEVSECWDQDQQGRCILFMDKRK